MGRLQHSTEPGWTYFVTTKTWQSRAVFQVSENARTLVECMFRYRDEGAFLLHEFVVMPNHLHLMLTPSDHTTLEKSMMLIKGGSSHEIHRQRGIKIQLWASGFHESSIRDLDDYLRKAAYIRNNPVEAHLVSKPEAWIFGSASLAFRMDELPQRLQRLSSGAKAPIPNESDNVGAKAPTPETARTGRQPIVQRSLTASKRAPNPPDEYLL